MNKQEVIRIWKLYLNTLRNKLLREYVNQMSIGKDVFDVVLKGYLIRMIKDGGSYKIIVYDKNKNYSLGFVKKFPLTETEFEYFKYKYFNYHINMPLLKSIGAI